LEGNDITAEGGRRLSEESQLKLKYLILEDANGSMINSKGKAHAARIGDPGMIAADNMNVKPADNKKPDGHGPIQATLRRTRGDWKCFSNRKTLGFWDSEESEIKPPGQKSPGRVSEGQICALKYLFTMIISS
jgi:hypothetical protein